MNTTSRRLLLLAGLSGAIAVGLGAMGAHSLPKQLEKRGLAPDLIAKKLDQCELAVRYQMYHALALVAIALSSRTTGSRLLTTASILFLVGTVCFSGGLYSIVFADQIIHWSIVPLGGSALIAAWLCIAASSMFGWQDPPSEQV